MQTLRGNQRRKRKEKETEGLKCEMMGKRTRGRKLRRQRKGGKTEEENMTDREKSKPKMIY